MIPVLRIAVVGPPGPARDELGRLLVGPAGPLPPLTVDRIGAIAGRTVDLVVLSTASPSADVRAVLAGLGPDVRLLVVSPVTGDDAVVDALRAGATSYLAEGRFGGAELAVAARRTAAGHSHLSPVALSAVVRRLQRPYSPAVPAAVLASLSQREQEIMALVAAGLSNADIARRLFLADKTVRNHLHGAYQKLAVRSRSEAVILWLGHRPVAARSTAPVHIGRPEWRVAT